MKSQQSQEAEMLEKRLKHLFQSKTIREYDEVNPMTHLYKKDINELERLVLEKEKMIKEMVGKLLPESVIYADRNTTLVFRVNGHVAPDIAQEMVNTIERITKCKCLFLGKGIELEDVMQRTREKNNSQEKSTCPPIEIGWTWLP